VKQQHYKPSFGDIIIVVVGLIVAGGLVGMVGLVLFAVVH
jgi:hypothetical protein